MLAVYKREMKAYFSSPIGYAFLAIFYYFGGQFFSSVLSAGVNQLEFVFSNLFSIVIFVIPLLTMRLLSEDKKQKTDQLLLTSPVKLSGVVMGKYLAAFTMYFIGIASTILYLIIMATFTTPNWNIFLGNFLALALLGGALLSIGLLISALTENQVVAAIGGFASMLLIFLIDSLVAAIPIQFISTALSKLSFQSRYGDFVAGILDVSHIIFFVSIIVVFNFLTVRVLERKRWN